MFTLWSPRLRHWTLALAKCKNRTESKKCLAVTVKIIEIVIVSLPSAVSLSQNSGLAAGLPDWGLFAIF